MTKRKIQYWVIPPKADGEFVACMEEVLETYEKPYDPACPVLCMDEQPVQLIQETRAPLPATREHPRRIDYEYARAGTASIFMFAEPLDGWRQATVRETKTRPIGRGKSRPCWKADMRTSRKSSWSVTTSTRIPKVPSTRPSRRRARALVRRIRFCHTPKHGSWLNIAENELSTLTRQCLSGRRFGTIASLRSEIAAWSRDVNDTQRGVDWQMKIGDARRKLKSLYPKIRL